MSDEINKQNAFNLSWESSGASSIEMVDRFHSMRGWQERHNPYRILKTKGTV